MDTLFSASSLLVMPFWLLLVFAPRWHVTERLARSPWIAAGPALLYAILITPKLPDVLPLLARPELGGIMALLGTPAGATIAWIHFLAFDLFVGRWVYLDGRERGVPPLVTSIVLALVLLVGPLGFVLHLLLRARFRPLVPSRVPS